MIKRHATRTLGLLAILILAVPASKAETKEINFRLDWSLYGSHAPFFLAQEEGLYEAEGLDITISEGQGSATVAKLIAQGDDQIGFVDFATMVRGVQEGMPITAVMRVLSGVMAVISPAEDPIEQPTELEGKVMAYAPDESTAQVLPALLKRNEVDPDQISVIQPAVGAKMALFLQGRADAIPGNVNVQVAQIEDKGKEVDYFLYSEFGVDVLANGIVANDEFAEENPDALRGFLRATRKAFEMAMEDPEAAVDAMIARNPKEERNRSTLLRQWELTIPALTTVNTQDEPFGYMARADWEDTQQILLDYADLPEAVELDRLYTNQYLPNE